MAWSKDWKQAGVRARAGIRSENRVRAAVGMVHIEQPLSRCFCSWKAQVANLWLPCPIKKLSHLEEAQWVLLNLLGCLVIKLGTNCAPDNNQWKRNWWYWCFPHTETIAEISVNFDTAWLEVRDPQSKIAEMKTRLSENVSSWSWTLDEQYHRADAAEHRRKSKVCSIVYIIYFHGNAFCEKAKHFLLSLAWVFVKIERCIWRRIPENQKVLVCHGSVLEKQSEDSILEIVRVPESAEEPNINSISGIGFHL